MFPGAPLLGSADMVVAGPADTSGLSPSETEIVIVVLVVYPSQRMPCYVSKPFRVARLDIQSSRWRMLGYYKWQIRPSFTGFFTHSIDRQEPFLCAACDI